MEKHENSKMSQGIRGNSLKLMVTHWQLTILVFLSGILLLAGVLILSKGRLIDNRVNDITVSSDGTLWVITWDGVSSFDGQIWKKYNGRNGVILSKYVKGGEDIDIAPDGSVWVVTHGGVSYFDGLNWNVQIVFDKFEANMPMAIESSGAIWFVTREGLERNHNNTRTSFTEGDGLLSSYTRDVAVSSSDILWAATSRGISRFDGISWTHFTNEDGLINNDIESLVISPNGSVWFAISDATVLRFDGMSWTSFTMDNPQVKGLFTWEMSAGLNEDICLGGREGINCFDGQSWYTIYLDNGFEGDYLENGIAVAPDGTLWVGSNKGLSHFDGQKWTNYSDTDGLLLGFGLIILAVILFGAGSLWFSKRTKVEKEHSGLREIPLIFNG